VETTGAILADDDATLAAIRAGAAAGRLPGRDRDEWPGPQQLAFALDEMLVGKPYGPTLLARNAAGSGSGSPSPAAVR
jgi:hypothetical protein